jgi:hypothetical protein
MLRPCYQTLGIYLASILFIISSDLYSQELEQTVRGVIESQKVIHSTLDSEIFCDPPSQNSSPMIPWQCPDHLQDEIKRNRGKFFDTIPSPNNVCSVDQSNQFPRPRSQMENHQALEKYYANSQYFSLHLPPDFISQCLARDSFNASEDEKEIIISTYYGNMMKLKSSLLASLDQLSTTDQVLGIDKSADPFWQAIDSRCQTSFIPESKTACEQAKDCPSKDHIDQMAKQSQQKVSEYVALKRKLAKLNRSRKKDPKKEKDLKSLMSTYERMIPWLRGDEFKKVLDRPLSVKSIADGIRKQFHFDREIVQKNIESFKMAIDCLNQSKKDGDNCKNYEETLQKAAELQLPENDLTNPAQTIPLIKAKQELEQAQCARESRSNSYEANNIVYGTLAQMALTLTPLGLPSKILSISKGASFGSKVLQTAKGAALEVSNLMKTPLGKIRLSLIATSIGSEFYYFSDDLKTMAMACTDKIRIPNDSPSSSLCDPDFEKYQSAVSDTQDCLLSVAFASLNALPLLPPALRAARMRRLSNMSTDARPPHQVQFARTLDQTASTKSDAHYLWDNWGHYDQESKTYHRFSLAASREVTTDQRHFQAHMRHFTSNDGHNWVDRGPIIKAGFDPKVQTVWSGSTHFDPKTKEWTLYFTGTTDDARKTQRLWKVTTKDHKTWSKPQSFIDPYSPEWKTKFLDQNYHLDDTDGIISAFRDPFRYGDDIFFATKAIDKKGRIRPVIGRMTEKSGKLEIQTPLFLDLPEGFTQAELPNLFSKNGKEYLTVTISNQGQIRGKAPDSFKSKFLLYEKTSEGQYIPSRDIPNSEVFNQDMGLYSGNVLRYGPDDNIQFFSFWHENQGAPGLTIPDALPLELK